MPGSLDNDMAVDGQSTAATSTSAFPSLDDFDRKPNSDWFGYCPSRAPVPPVRNGASGFQLFIDDDPVFGQQSSTADDSSLQPEPTMTSEECDELMMRYHTELTEMDNVDVSPAALADAKKVRVSYIYLYDPRYGVLMTN